MSYVPSGMHWTDERVEKLRVLWLDGMSASRIAREIGGITRNSVIAKVHRLHLELLPRKNPPHTRTNPVRLPKPGRGVRLPKPPGEARKRDEDGLLPPMKVAGPPPAVETVPELPTDVTVLDLRRGMCRFPLWDHDAHPTYDNAFYCGAAAQPDGDGFKAYCPAHAAISFQPRENRVRHERRQGEDRHRISIDAYPYP